MPTACILQPQASVHLKSRRLEIMCNDPENGNRIKAKSIPINDLDRLIVSEFVQLSSQAVSELLRQSVPISILGWNGRFLGGYLPASEPQGLFRMKQYKRSQDEVFAIHVAKQWVRAKIYNQRRVLQRLDNARRSRESAEEKETSDETARTVVSDLTKLFDATERSASIDETRGFEGAATAMYFRAWSTFFPPEVVFERRSTRPPLNPINACMSFGSTIIYTEAVAFLHAHGLDPALGTLHVTENRRWSLALDMIEPFRPALSEALTLDLFSRQMLKPERHFEQKQGGVYLNEEGRRKFLLQYERRMERQFLSELVGHRTSLRSQLEAQAQNYKVALDDLDRLNPFRMN